MRLSPETVWVLAANGDKDALRLIKAPRRDGMVYLHDSWAGAARLRIRYPEQASVAE